MSDISDPRQSTALPSTDHSVAQRRGIRGAFLDFVGDPFYCSEADVVRYYDDGLLVIGDGLIQAFGDYEQVRSRHPDIAIETVPGLITPGFIDSHVHYPQTEIIAAYGAQLMEWLERYTFPAERQFIEADYARKIAKFFLDELLQNGITTAVVLTTIFSESVEVFFQEAQRRNLRMIAGQVLMSRNAPDFLIKDPEVAYGETRSQIQCWHGQGRQLYAITPRFAITSTEVELTLAGQLKQEFPEVFVHTHLSENVKEIEFTAQLFPNSRDYLQVYEQFGLVGDRSIFAHCIHLDASSFQRLSEAGAAIAYCPTSNLFLGSGLFPLHRVKGDRYPVDVGLATDVGGGSSFSMLRTMATAYQIAQLQLDQSQGQSLSAFRAFYLATLGAAQSLHLDQVLGNFEVGKEADFISLNLQATPLLALRNAQPIDSLATLAEQLFATMILGDDRAIQATYIAGERWGR